MRVVHVLADNTQVNDITGHKVSLDNSIYFVCQSIEKGAGGHDQIKEKAKGSRILIAPDGSSIPSEPYRKQINMGGNTRE